MTTTIETQGVPRTKGRVMRAEARYYDLLAWLLTLGREQALRERLVALAQLAPGETVLDVGCGTGTLAIAAKRRVGASGIVRGIDASVEMITVAKTKAAKAGVEVEFQPAVVEALPFPDASFDAVLSTLMLHHLPRAVREQSAAEMRRVLKPGGRILVVDFATPAGERRGLLARLHRHGHTALADIVALLRESGVRVAESGSVGVSDLHFVVGRAPTKQDDALTEAAPPVNRSLPPLPRPRWVLPLVVLAFAAMHLLVISGASMWQMLTAVSVVGVTVIAIGMHAGVVGLVGAIFARRRRQN